MQCRTLAQTVSLLFVYYFFEPLLTVYVPLGGNGLPILRELADTYSTEIERMRIRKFDSVPESLENNLNLNISHDMQSDFAQGDNEQASSYGQ